jgi:putative transposase
VRQEASAGAAPAPGLSPPDGACARTPVRPYDTISVEAIQPATLSRRPAPKQDEHDNGDYAHNGASRKAGRNTRIHDAGWSAFLTLLTCTAACAGKRVAAVNPASTSQDCSGGGARIHKTLSVRTQVCTSVRLYVCTTCGLILDRDENAARNMLWRGQRLRGLPALAGGMNREPVGL